MDGDRTLQRLVTGYGAGATNTVQADLEMSMKVSPASTPIAGSCATADSNLHSRHGQTLCPRSAHSRERTAATRRGHGYLADSAPCQFGYSIVLGGEGTHHILIEHNVDLNIQLVARMIRLQTLDVSNGLCKSHGQI